MRCASVISRKYIESSGHTAHSLTRSEFRAEGNYNILSPKKSSHHRISRKTNFKLNANEVGQVNINNRYYIIISVSTIAIVIFRIHLIYVCNEYTRNTPLPLFIN